MGMFSDGTKIQLAFQAIQQDVYLSVRHTAATYKVTERARRRRRDKTLSQRNCVPDSMKLTRIEDNIIARCGLKQEERGCLPRLSDVKGMANPLLAERYQPPVGKD